MSSDDRAPDEPERVVIRDNRKIDPETGQARKPATGADGAAAPSAPADGAQTHAEENDMSKEAQLLEERTLDLQRLQAEYANYRKRAERDKLAAGDLAVGRTVAQLLPVVDDLERAKAHGDLTGALKSIADKLDFVLDKLGLVAFGEVGDLFDPSIHEAVMHDESAEVKAPTATSILRVGYLHKDRLLRPAMVGVSDPATPSPETASEAEGDLASEGKHHETNAQPHEAEVPAEDDQDENPAAKSE